MQPFQNSYNPDQAKKVCSDVTLFNPKQGFFPNWVDQVTKTLSPQFIHNFSQLQNDRDRIRTMWEVNVVHSITVHPLFTGKKATISEERRQDGNEAFKNGDDKKALAFYTQAVIRAPRGKDGEGGSHLSLALANRSAVLYRMNEFQTCLQDIELALQEEYPKNLHYKAVDRRGQCLWKMGRYKEAKKCFKQCIQLLKFSNLDEPRVQEMTKDLKARVLVSETYKDTSSTNGAEKDLSEEPLFEGSSPILPKASSAVEMQYSNEKGRYITCSTVIPAGSVLVKEEPFTSVLMPEKNGLCCCHCYKKLLAPLPCLTCSNTAFCSLSCRSSADMSYHKYECQFADQFRGSGMSLNCYMALRSVTERGLKRLKNTCLPTADEPALIPSANNPYDGRNINNILRLVALEDRRERLDMLQRTLMAIFLLKVLKKSDYFGRKEKEGRPLLDDHFVIGCILLRMLQLAQFNSHELSAISYQGELSFKNSKSVYIGLALYPTVSFLNHSCFPAVGRYFNGKEICIITLRPLKKGEIVSENYGPIFTHHNREERRAKLMSRYWFNCMCEACVQDWPKIDFLPNEFQLSCSACEMMLRKAAIGGERGKKKEANQNVKNGKEELKCDDNLEKDVEKCSKCGYSSNVDVFYKLKEAHKEYDTGKTHMDNYRREDAIKSFLRFVEAVLPRCQLPIKDVHTVLQALRHLVFHRGKTAIFSSTS